MCWDSNPAKTHGTWFQELMKLRFFILKLKLKSLSHVRLFGIPWTVAYQAPQSMEFSRQEYWSGLPLPSHVSLQKELSERHSDR